jgi:hypothetical protein
VHRAEAQAADDACVMAVAAAAAHYNKLSSKAQQRTGKGNSSAQG